MREWRTTGSKKTLFDTMTAVCWNERLLQGLHCIPQLPQIKHRQCKHTLYLERHNSKQLLWMETESKNKTGVLEQNENYAKLILSAKIPLLAPDCLKRCVSNHTLAQIPLGCVYLYPHSHVLFACESVRVLSIWQSLIYLKLSHMYILLGTLTAPYDWAETHYYSADAAFSVNI